MSRLDESGWTKHGLLLERFLVFILCQEDGFGEAMRDITHEDQPITRRTVLGIAGLTILAGSSVARISAGGDVEISIGEECSSATIEMHPPDDTTWTGVVESLKGSELARTPTTGQTVTGGGSGNLQVSLSSPSTYVRRAFVVEGTNLEGPVVAKKSCEVSDGDSGQNYDGCRTGNDSEVQSQSSQVDIQVNTGNSTTAVATNDGGSSQNASAISVSDQTTGEECTQIDGESSRATSSDAEAIVESALKRLGLD